MFKDIPTLKFYWHCQNGVNSWSGLTRLSCNQLSRGFFCNLHLQPLPLTFTITSMTLMWLWRGDYRCEASSAIFMSKTNSIRRRRKSLKWTGGELRSESTAATGQSLAAATVLLLMMQKACKYFHSIKSALYPNVISIFHNLSFTFDLLAALSLSLCGCCCCCLSINFLTSHSRSNINIVWNACVYCSTEENWRERFWYIFLCLAPGTDIPGIISKENEAREEQRVRMNDQTSTQVSLQYFMNTNIHSPFCGSLFFAICESWIYFVCDVAGSHFCLLLA